MKLLSTLPPAHRNKGALRYLSGEWEPFFSYSPTADGLKSRLEGLSRLRFDRDRLLEGLSEAYPPGKAAAATRENLEKIKDKASVFVTAGHQANLGGGPLFVAYKILTAVKLAQWTEKKIGIPAIPLFWLATDDSDVDEVLRATAPDLSTLAFDPGPFKGLAGQLPSPERQCRTLPQIPAQNWGEYHRRLLDQVFGRFGLVIADPLSPGMQRLRRPFFDNFLPKAAAARAEILAAGENLRALGIKPQVKVRRNDHFVFVLEGGERRRLETSRLSPGDLPLTSALSRLPSLEHTLPLLCDVAGPSEIAYHAQTLPLYQASGRTVPVIFPRFSATLAREADISLLASHGLSAQEVISDRAKAEGRLGEASIPPAAAESLRTHFEAVERHLAALERELSKTDPRLAGPTRAAGKKAARARAYLWLKLTRFAKKKALMRNPVLSGALNFLYPGNLQERVFNFLYFTQADPGFCDKILSAIDPFDFNHRVLEWQDK